MSKRETDTKRGRRVWYCFNTFSYLALFLGFSCLSFAQKSHQSESSSRSLLSAEEAEWDWKDGRFQLTGNVSLKLKIKDQTLSLKCQEASLYLKQNGEDPLRQALPEFSQDSLQKIIVKGAVELRYNSLLIKTAELVYEHTSGIVIVKGLLKGQWGDQRLSGQDLRLNIHQSQALLSKPKFKFLWTKDTHKKSIWGR
ncbi:MAG: hypothetical protein CMH49_00415 [Myxococcales bacterium]|nr:hypothetical protein [Myxococcales bacterium]